ncbi:hypothetical protein HMPREF1485_01318 [Propionibacterium sp. HGH0353]|nr:hypothetical protein HMPREF1485_01318 [Propionibacterium sp. HGH0353]
MAAWRPLHRALLLLSLLQTGRDWTASELAQHLDRVQDAASQAAPLDATMPDFPAASIQEWLTTDFRRSRTHDN